MRTRSLNGGSQSIGRHPCHDIRLVPSVSARKAPTSPRQQYDSLLLARLPTMAEVHALDDYYLAITLLITIAYQLFFFSIAFSLKFDKLTGRLPFLVS